MKKTSMMTTRRRLPTLSNRSQDFKNAMKKIKKPRWHAIQKTEFQMLNDDELMTSVQEESDPVDSETDEDEDNNNENSKSPSNADAFSALEIAMEWYEQQLECCPTQPVLLKRIRDFISEKKTKVHNGTEKNK
ncbi:hypothetical protein TNCV_1253211 [Trichonephila clavipes]|nr:hypothetical protein TNCV_1253211 [Trichonephila clavipes]